MANVNATPQTSICDDFLRFASTTVQNTRSSEGYLRSAISRAYYSTYLTARDQLFGPDGIGLNRKLRNVLTTKFKKNRNRTPGSHDIVLFAITDLKGTNIIHPLVLYQQIDELKEARTHADYHFTDSNLASLPYASWSDYANKMVALASQILPVTRRLPSYPTT